jgi:hypothetical protein
MLVKIRYMVIPLRSIIPRSSSKPRDRFCLENVPLEEKEVVYETKKLSKPWTPSHRGC